MNGIIVIDKPKGFTSHDVVAKSRGILKTRKIGHGGTLDPNATGVLPLFVGNATKAVSLMPCEIKKYTALVRMGIKTDSGDITGDVVETSDIPEREAVLAALPAFMGEIEQIPPMFSAVRVNGKRLYELARKGETAERAPRRVTIFELAITEWRENGFVLETACSKGTYIRTLAQDICAAAGAAGTIEELRRTQTMGFGLESSVTLPELERLAGQGMLESALIRVEKAFSDLPRLTLDEGQTKSFLNGVRLSRQEPDGCYAVYSGGFIAVADIIGGLLCKKAAFIEG